MTTPAEYRQYADECLKAIWIAKLPEIRALLLSMARRWVELAERTEQHEQSQHAEVGRQPFEEKKPPAPASGGSPREH